MVSLKILSPPALTGVFKSPELSFNLGNMHLRGGNAIKCTGQIEISLMAILGLLLVIKLAHNGFIAIAPCHYKVPHKLGIRLK